MSRPLTEYEQAQDVALKKVGIAPTAEKLKSLMQAVDEKRRAYKKQGMILPLKDIMFEVVSADLKGIPPESPHYRSWLTALGKLFSLRKAAITCEKNAKNAYYGKKDPISTAQMSFKFG